MPPEPRDLILYNKIKKKVYKKIPTHSAYRSGILVQQYKKAFKKKYPKRFQANCANGAGPPI